MKNRFPDAAIRGGKEGRAAAASRLPKSPGHANTKITKEYTVVQLAAAGGNSRAGFRQSALKTWRGGANPKLIEIKKAAKRRRIGGFANEKHSPVQTNNFDIPQGYLQKRNRFEDESGHGFSIPSPSHLPSLRNAKKTSNKRPWLITRKKGINFNSEASVGEITKKLSASTSDGYAAFISYSNGGRRVWASGFIFDWSLYKVPNIARLVTKARKGPIGKRIGKGVP